MPAPGTDHPTGDLTSGVLGVRGARLVGHGPEHPGVYGQRQCQCYCYCPGPGHYYGHGLSII